MSRLLSNGKNECQGTVAVSAQGLAPVGMLHVTFLQGLNMYCRLSSVAAAGAVNETLVLGL